MHNNYLTLPVVFTMLAGHFPLAFGSGHAWLVLLALFAIVAAIRHFFNLLALRRDALVDPRRRPRPERSRSRSCSLRRNAGGREPVSRRRGAGDRLLRAAPLPRRRLGAAGVRLDTLAGMRANAAEIQRQVSARRDAARERDRDDGCGARQLVAWAAAAG